MVMIYENMEMTRYVQISGREILSGHRTFLESILHQFGGSEKLRCDSGRMFLRHLNSVLISDLKHVRRVVVAVHHTELLREKEHEEILHAFINAQDYIRKNVCFLLCSTLPWDRLNHCLLKELPTLHFQQYKIGEIKSILSAKQQNAISQDLFVFYVDTIVDYFHMCRDLRQLTRLVVSQYSEFSDRVHQLSKVDRTNTLKLFQILKPKLKDVYKTMNSTLTPMCPSIGSSSKGVKRGNTRILNEIPVYSKYILIAAYIASRNPVNSDRKFFVKARGIRKNRKVNNPVVLKPVKTPQAIPLARLLAVLVSLNKEIRIPVGLAIRNQIIALCNVGLMSRVGDDLDECKYRCLANKDLINIISRSVDIEIDRYLCR